MRFFLIIITFLVIIVACKKNKDKEFEKKSYPVITSKNLSSNIISDTVTITAVGDIMIGSNYPSISYLPGVNILEEIKPVLKEKTDLIVGNLEGTLFDSGGKPKSCTNPNFCFVFRTPFAYGRYLKEAGFDFLSMANNHSNDFGSMGRIATEKNLKSLGIQYAGILKHSEYAIKEKNGIRYAFIGAGHNVGLVSSIYYTDIKRIIKEVRPKVDIVIVMFHGGGEGASYQHIPFKNEFYAGENRGNVVEFAHACIDSGADLILGSGPHVARAIELYNNKFIAYSLGNFATYGKITLTGPNGNAPILKIKTDVKGNFISCHVVSIIQSKGSKKGPEIDHNHRAYNYIKHLTLTDFPNNRFIFTSSGEIKVKPR
ncbi:MAG: CapA family protein [Apibacter sp.]|nr:CapA family protein [Apibacter sp.]